MILPLGIIVAATVVAMAFYFWKTTGQPFQPPYLVYERTYSSVPLFPWVKLKPELSYTTSALQNFYEGQREVFSFALQHPVLNILYRIFLFWLFYLGPMLTIPFLILLLALPVGAKLSDFPAAMRFLLLAAGVSFAGMALPFVFIPHYAAPITALVYAFVLWTMRYIRPWFFGTKPVGLGITRAVVVSCVLLAVVRISAPISGIALTPPEFRTWGTENHKFRQRPVISSELNAREGSHLVFVLAHNETNPSPFDWVFNAADIDASKIVWARDLGAAKNQELIDYYKGRTVWILDPADRHPRLMPYPLTWRRPICAGLVTIRARFAEGSC